MALSGVITRLAGCEGLAKLQYTPIFLIYEPKKLESHCDRKLDLAPSALLRNLHRLVTSSNRKTERRYEPKKLESHCDRKLDLAPSALLRNLHRLVTSSNRKAERRYEPKKLESHCDRKLDLAPSALLRNLHRLVTSSNRKAERRARRGRDQDDELFRSSIISWIILFFKNKISTSKG